jgi:hypothetical protein
MSLGSPGHDALQHGCSTSVSQAIGSTPFIFADWIRVIAIDQ